MRRYLIVANQTLGGDQLLQGVRERIQAGDCHFHVLVPATPSDQLDPEYLAAATDATGQAPPEPTVAARGDAAPAGALAAHEPPTPQHAHHLLEHEVEDISPEPATEDLGRVLARQRLGVALARLRGLGANASGEVGVADPHEAIGVALHRHEFDEVLLSTLPGRRSRWLAMDLPRRIRRSYKLPVAHIAGPPDHGI